MQGAQLPGDGSGLGGAVQGSGRAAAGKTAEGGHQRRKAIHSFKAHVGADADTALVEALCVTPGNVHDGRAGGGALSEAPGDVYADSAYRGPIFGSVVTAKGGSPRIVLTGMWGSPGDDTLHKLRRWNYAIQRVRCRIEKIFGTWKRSYAFPIHGRERRLPLEHHRIRCGHLTGKDARQDNSEIMTGDSI